MLVKKIILLSIITLAFSANLFAQPFEKDLATTEALPDLANGIGIWGDYDLDGDLDILLSGHNSADTVLNIYKNNGMGYNMIISDFQALTNSHCSWCDYDNDGDLDFFAIGSMYSDSIITTQAILYQNLENDQFETANAEFQGVHSGISVWGDLDNDGDEDMVIIGNKGEEGSTRIYQNDGDGQFSQISHTMVKIYNGDIALGDYDNDQDNDILLIGKYKDLQGSEIKTLKLYKNHGDFSFEEVYSGFIGMSESNISWGDYDADGDLDILANGSTEAPTHLIYIYQNQGNDFFENIGIEIFGTVNGSIDWGDYDTDGDLDFVLTGMPSYTNEPITEIYRNVNVNLFNKEENQSLSNVYNGSSHLGDYDNDGDLDIILTGNTVENSEPVSVVFRNQNELNNSSPSIPSNLISNVTGNEVIISWSPSDDLETPTSGLTYNIRIGITPNGFEIAPPLANNDGKRLVQKQGNVGLNKSWHIKNLEPGIYYWSVQAIDNNFQGSDFAEENIFEITSTGINGDIMNTSNDNYFIHNYPNPFSDETYFNFELTINQKSRIFITNQQGKTVRKFENKRQRNTNSIMWDGKNDAGELLENGIYYFIIQDENHHYSCKTLLFK